MIDDVKANPDVTLLKEQCQRFQALDTPVEVIVALGGGSVIDSAKVFATARGDFERVASLLEHGSGQETFATTPIIAVPTTAGTGS